jgi:hypothetical protein
VYFNLVGHAFDRRVVERAGRRVPAEILGLPQVDPDRAAGLETLGRADEKQSQTTSHIQHALITPPDNLVEIIFALAHLADLAVVNHPQAHRSAAQAGPDQWARDHRDEVMP